MTGIPHSEDHFVEIAPPIKGLHVVTWLPKCGGAHEEAIARHEMMKAIGDLIGPLDAFDPHENR